jgi:hypothetical protein
MKRHKRLRENWIFMPLAQKTHDSVAGYLAPLDTAVAGLLEVKAGGS